MTAFIGRNSDARTGNRQKILGNSSGGTLTTSGGLVFFGDDANSFEAVDAKSGRALWHFNTGQRFVASPMTYAVDGIQYVAIAAESDIFVFVLQH